ncbi:uncharacterized protein [Antedon mediterranea]|uniref:uncharacterized protein n=1 Tax=Antedon mediterranea TaxID=105859 RepID=UPI003AF6AABA
MYFNIRRPPGMPPGPTPYPVIGHLHILMEKQPAETFKELSKDYGPVFSLKVGRYWAVVLNNYESVQDALLTKLNDFSGRPHSFMTDLLSDNGKDIAAAQPTQTWKFHRKLAHLAIRDYATKELETLLIEIRPKIKDVVEQKAGAPFNPKEVITLVVYNIVASMCFGKQYQFNDPQLVRFVKLLEELFAAIGNGALPDFIPATRFLPSNQINKLNKLLEEYFGLLLAEIHQHMETYSPDEPANDLIELLLKSQKDELTSDGSQTKLTDVHIKQILSDLFIAGTDTITTTLLWGIACLMDNPDVQEKIKNELDDVIGDRPPKLSDRGNLPYTEATIMEIMRYGTVTPLAETHRAIKDSTIGKFKVPENTWVIVNTWALHNDSKYWDSPEKFTPERFLDSTSSVKQRHPSFLPFSTGRRVCVGESLAKAEMFLIFTWFCQNFKFEKPPGVTEVTAVSGCAQAVNFPKPYKAVVQLQHYAHLALTIYKTMFFCKRMFECTSTSLAVVLIILLLTWMYFNIRRPLGMPPGPTPYPILGNVPTLIGENPPWELFKDMTSKYGPIFSIKFGNYWSVVLNNYEIVQEALLTKSNDFSGRPISHLLDWFSDNGKDITFAQPTPTWKFHRKLAHSAVRKYATGDLETLIEEVRPKIRDVLSQKAGTPFNPKEVITLAVYNVVASMCFGHDYNFKDPQLLRFVKLLEEINDEFGNGTLADFVPAARFLPSPQVNRLKKAGTEFLTMILTEVNQHLKTYSPDEPANDLIELLLKTQKDEMETDSSASKLTDVHIKQIASDIFFAGTDTTTAALLWAVACVIDNPDVQGNIKRELDDVIGDRPARLNDRGKLPYTEAVIMETMRFGTVAPLGLTRCAVKDSTIGNYMVPESTWVFINTWALHNDSKYWDSPEKFKPERFLDTNGSVKQRLPSFLPFSAGRRVCVGQALAKAEIFLVFTWLIQNYTFEKAPGVNGDIAISGKPQQLNVPRPYQTVAHPR